MKLTVFAAEKGDCLLLESADGKRVLVDGGMTGSYTEHVAPTLADLAAQGAAIDLVYVSHIDEDHIAGVLQLLDDTMAWRVFDYQVGEGNANARQPARGRPPAIRDLWHNGFSALVSKNAGAIGEMLSTTAAIFAGASGGELAAEAVVRRELAQSVRQALRLSNRISSEQLAIPLNRAFDGRLAQVDSTAAIRLGKLRLRVIGPFSSDLIALRKEWNEWLRANREAVRALRRDAERDAGAIGNRVEDLLARLLEQATRLGERARVTTPNLASLMLHVKEGEASLLLTGDGHWQDVLRGLEHHGLWRAGERRHVTLLKVQHHGSEHNIHRDFCRAVTADHYVFCGNGEHQNPDPRVVELIARERFALGDGAPFKFWFNAAGAAPGRPRNQAHMRHLEALVAQLEAASNGRLSSFFLDGASFAIAV